MPQEKISLLRQGINKFRGTSTPLELSPDTSYPTTSYISATSTPVPNCKRRLPFSTPSPADQILTEPSSYSGVQYEDSYADQGKFDERLSHTVTSSNLSYQVDSLTLQNIAMTRYSQLDTPRKKFLYKYAKKKESEIKKLTKKCKKMRRQMQNLCDPMNLTVNAVHSLSKHMSAASLRCLSSYLKSSWKTPRARRWTVEEKTLALSLYKRSPKAYTLFSNILALPCKKTLKRLVNKLPFSSGINDQMFATLTQHVDQLNKRDRICTLIFDEMSIREHLQYNCSSDRIDGFEDLGHKGRTGRVANHALVFMVRGLFRMWKQPVAYYFSHSSMRSDILAELIFFILDACCKAGLYVVATVCDMGATNIKALKIMGSANSEHPYFLFNNRPVFTILDPPHLLKCTRNVFLKYNVKCHVETGSLAFDGEAKWDHIKTVFHWDRGVAIFRQLHHLTKQHVQPLGSQKMKVRLAAQVLSHRVAACINSAVSCGK